MAIYKGGNALIFMLKLRGPRSVIARRSLPLYHTSAFLSIEKLHKYLICGSRKFDLTNKNYQVIMYLSNEGELKNGQEN